MPAAKQCCLGPGPQRVAGQREKEPMAGWPVGEQGGPQLALALMRVWDKALRLSIQTGEYLASHLSSSPQPELIKGFRACRGSSACLFVCWCVPVHALYGLIMCVCARVCVRACACVCLHAWV